jgi:16S rRNA U1498 N3-methylase RsmE
VQLTKIGSSSANVSTSLDKLRAVVVAALEQAERAIATA